MHTSTVVLHTVYGLGLIGLAACSAGSRPTAQPSPSAEVPGDYGAMVRVSSATSKVRTVTGEQLLAGPSTLSAKLGVIGAGPVSSALILVDGQPRFGIEALNSLDVKDIARVDVIRTTWGGMRDYPLNQATIVSVTTRKSKL